MDAEKIKAIEMSVSERHLPKCFGGGSFGMVFWKAFLPKAAEMAKAHEYTVFHHQPDDWNDENVVWIDFVSKDDPMRVREGELYAA